MFEESASRRSFGVPVPDYRQLLADKQVRFAGYMQPHPLENKIHIKVRRAGRVQLDNDVREWHRFDNSVVHSPTLRKKIAGRCTLK